MRKILLLAMMIALLLTACSATMADERPKATLAPGKWHDNYKLVAHALGAVDEVPYTNSLEAFLENYKKGLRVFEVDLIRGADGILVARHDWYKSSYDNLQQDYPGNIAPSMDSNDFKNKIEYWIENPQIRNEYKEKYRNLGASFKISECMNQLEKMFIEQISKRGNNK